MEAKERTAALEADLRGRIEALEAEFRNRVGALEAEVARLKGGAIRGVTGRCEALTHDGDPCSRPAARQVNSLNLCHQHAQVAERDSARASSWIGRNA